MRGQFSRARKGSSKGQGEDRTKTERKITTKTVFFLLYLVVVVLARCTSGTELENTLCEVYCLLNDLIPIIAFTLFALGGAAYAIGNFFGPEVRAKAHSWAMSCVTGAIIGLLIVTFSSLIITNLMPEATIPTC